MAEYREVLGGKFKVSSDGDHIIRIRNGKEVTAAINFGGGREGTKYAYTTYCENGKRMAVCVHRLVAEAFIPNPNNYPAINHLDGNSHNNHVANIEWCTYSQNTIHAYKTGLIQPMRNASPCIMCGNLTRTKTKTCSACRRIDKNQREHLAVVERRVATVEYVAENRLTAGQLKAIELRKLGKTFREIGETMGMSKQRVEQLISRAKPCSRIQTQNNG